MEEVGDAGGVLCVVCGPTVVVWVVLMRLVVLEMLVRREVGIGGVPACW